MNPLTFVPFLLLIHTSVTYRSGIYVDNGLDQTVMHHELTNVEMKEMETELLHILDLPPKPPKLSANRTLEKSSTKFLMELHETFMEKENNGRITRAVPNIFGLSQQDLNFIDAVMTFDNRDNHVSSVRHERGKRLWFDVSEIPPSEVIVGAEVRIYQKADYKQATGKLFTISLYEVINTYKGERELEFISSINTTRDFDGWLEMNATGPLVNWVAFPRSNKGLYLSVHATNKPNHEIKPEEIGLVGTRGSDDKQPFLVAFFKQTPKGSKTRKPRGAGRKKKSDYNVNPSYYSRATDPLNQEQSRNCQIQTLYVSFKELQWQEWIIAPVGFEAYFCTGECSFPLNAHMNATNHAIVQTLVHLMNPIHVPKPCCAPTKLSGISVLYFRDDNEVTLKKYKNMVVKSCGCH